MAWQPVQYLHDTRITSYRPEYANYYGASGVHITEGEFNAAVDYKGENFVALGEADGWSGVVREWITLENGNKITRAFSISYDQYGHEGHTASVGFYDANNVLQGDVAITADVDFLYFAFGINEDSQLSSVGFIYAYNNNVYVYPSGSKSDILVDWNLPNLLNFLDEDYNNPTQYMYEPVSYLKGNMTFTSLSMVKKVYLNGGNPLNVGSNTKPFERLITPTLEALGNQLALNTERHFAYASDTNSVSITKTNVSGDDTTYVLKYYINSTEDSSLRQTYVCTAGEKHYFSFIFNDENLVARPSVIREYPVVNQTFHEYNQETITSAMLTKYYTWLSDSRQTEIPDPYNQGSEATSTDNPSGTFDRTNDPVNFPTAPSTNLLATGFFRAYLASKTDLASLATYLWGAGFDLDTLKKIFASPIDSILHCLGIPLALTSTELLRDVYLGNVNSSVQMKPVSSQVVVVDCGSIDLYEFYGSYLDYAPYTRLSLYLPYIGVVGISVDDVMGKEVSVKYYVDVLTGACLALVKADDNVLYHYTGACGIDVPLTASDYTSVISGIWGAVTTVASGIATAVTGGAAAPLLVGSVAQTANNVMASKPQTQRSGGFTAITGLMDVQYPHIILEIPEQCHVNNQNRFKGYPIHKDYTLSELTGYTEIEAIHLENMTCTDTELQEIETLLEGGVIL